MHSIQFIHGILEYYIFENVLKKCMVHRLHITSSLAIYIREHIGKVHDIQFIYDALKYYIYENSLKSA